MNANEAIRNTQKFYKLDNGLDSDVKKIISIIDELIKKESLAGKRHILYDIRKDKCKLNLDLGYDEFEIFSIHYRDNGFSLNVEFPNVKISW